VLPHHGSMTATTYLNRLNSRDLRRRLERLDRERAALVVLLRAAVVRERRGRKEARHAR
jgi:hypothetical protein